jgi:hypothetical protein
MESSFRLRLAARLLFPGNTEVGLPAVPPVPGWGVVQVARALDFGVLAMPPLFPFGVPMTTLEVAVFSFGVPMAALGLATLCLGVPMAALGVATFFLGVPMPALGLATLCLGVPMAALGVAILCLGEALLAWGVFLAAIGGAMLALVLLSVLVRLLLGVLSSALHNTHGVSMAPNLVEAQDISFK